MRRTEFIKGIQQLHDALIESQLQSLLASMQEAQDEAPATAQVLTVLKEYSLQARQFNEAASQLAHLLDLDELESPDTWSQLIDRRDPAFVRHQHERVSVVTGYLPQVAALLHRSARQTLEAAGLSHDDEGRLTVVVVEQEDRLSSPQRLSELFAGLEKLYEVCAVVAGVKGDKLSVLSCESGRDKAFDLVGMPAVINELKNLILSMWDRVVFFRERDLPERIERVAESLFMHERIRTLEQEQTIGPEQAEILRRALTNGVTKFMEAGAIIPEIENRAQHDPRRLMSPEPKLLVSGTEEDASPVASRKQAPPADHEASSEPASITSASSVAPHGASSPNQPETSLSPTGEQAATAEAPPPSLTGDASSEKDTGKKDPTPAPEDAATPDEPTTEEAPAQEEEPPPADRDGVMEVLEAIAERHESEQEEEERASAGPSPPSREPDSSTEEPKEADEPRKAESAMADERADEPAPSSEPATEPPHEQPAPPREASTEEAPSSSSSEEQPETEENSGPMKGLNRMIDRIGGGEHLFGNPEKGGDEAEEN